MKKKLFCVALCVVVTMGLMVGCGSSSEKSSTAKDSYTIEYNNFGKGAYPLDLNQKETKYAVEAVGSKLKTANDNFTVDNVISDVKNLISSKVDGVVVWTAADTLYGSLDDLMKESKMPFALGDKYPKSEKTIKKLQDNKYFAGAVSTDDVLTGKNIAKAAYKDGHRTTLIVAAAVGDTNHDARVKGFTQEFTKLGGKVLGTVHCADPSEAVQKSGDLLAAHKNADCLYGSGGDYSNGALKAMSSAGISMPVYGTDIDPNVIKGIKNGKIKAANGAAGTYCASFAAMLLINYLDGHPIKDKDGKAPATKGLQTIMVTKANVKNYEKYWINGEIFSKKEFQNLLYRNNKNVSWKDYQDMIDNYNYKTRMEAVAEK